VANAIITNTNAQYRSLVTAQQRDIVGLPGCDRHHREATGSTNQ